MDLSTFHGRIIESEQCIDCDAQGLLCTGSSDGRLALQCQECGARFLFIPEPSLISQPSPLN